MVARNYRRVLPAEDVRRCRRADNRYRPAKRDGARGNRHETRRAGHSDMRTRHLRRPGSRAGGGG